MSAWDILNGLECGRGGCPCHASARRGHGLTHCPAHDDQKPSLSITERNGVALVKCHTGCQQEAVITALRERKLWQEPEQKRGLMLAELAVAKGLPADFLRSLGWHDSEWFGRPAVAIPWVTADGHTWLHYRIELTGDDRFRWQKGAPAKELLYGVGRTDRVREAGWGLLVEGETDSAAGWLHNLPVFGLPGKGVWNPGFAEHLRSIGLVVWQEPDAEDLVERMRHDVPELRLIEAAKVGFKDLCEANQVLGDKFSAWFDRLLRSTTSAKASQPHPNGSGPAVSIITQSEPAWPAGPSSDAYVGLPSRIVQLVEPYVESDRAAILPQFLTAFGIAAGIRPHFMVGGTRHAPATYIGLIGRTSRARKGTSWDPIELLIKEAADQRFKYRIMSGLGSGERLVGLVRDPERNEKPDDAPDRRLLLQEPEIARLLVAINREGSTLSAYLRQAFDGKPLRNEVKFGGSVASIHHIGLIGHGTQDELRNRLTEREVRNGLANRIAWFLARRVQRLADPPTFDPGDPAVAKVVTELQGALTQARDIHRVRRSDAAQRLWADWYTSLPDDQRSVVARVTDRAEAHVIRFSLIYALTDGSLVIEVIHLRAAIALWEYSARCVAYIFGDATGNLIADRIRAELTQGPLDRYDDIVVGLFNRHVNAQQLEEAASLLESRGELVRERIPTGKPGRPAERWRCP